MPTRAPSYRDRGVTVQLAAALRAVDVDLALAYLATVEEITGPAGITLADPALFRAPDSASHSTDRAGWGPTVDAAELRRWRAVQP